MVDIRHIGRWFADDYLTNREFSRDKSRPAKSGKKFKVGIASIQNIFASLFKSSKKQFENCAGTVKPGQVANDRHVIR